MQAISRPPIRPLKVSTVTSSSIERRVLHPMGAMATGYVGCARRLEVVRVLWAAHHFRVKLRIVLSIQATQSETTVPKTDPRQGTAGRPDIGTRIRAVCSSGFRGSILQFRSAESLPNQEVLYGVNNSNKKAPICSDFTPQKEPSDGLEASTPSLPCDPNGNRWQPVATVVAKSNHFRGLDGRNVCELLRPLCSVTVPSE